MLNSTTLAAPQPGPARGQRKIKALGVDDQHVYPRRLSGEVVGVDRARGCPHGTRPGERRLRCPEARGRVWLGGWPICMSAELGTFQARGTLRLWQLQSDADDTDVAQRTPPVRRRSCIGYYD